MTEPATSSIGARLRTVGAFLAIVWGVAGSFVVLDVLSVSSMDWMVDPSTPGDSFATPSAVRNSTLCRVPAPAPQAGRPGHPELRAAAWSLGVETGRYARTVVALREAPRDSADPEAQQARAVLQPQVDAADAAASRLAGALNVPRLPPFEPRTVAGALIEFVPFVEGDANHTARALAMNYGVDACELYKLGVYWGYSGLTRINVVGEQNAYAVEIAYYASRRALPESVWRPLVARTPRRATQRELVAETDYLTDQVRAHLRAAR